MYPIIKFPSNIQEKLNSRRQQLSQPVNIVKNLPPTIVFPSPKASSYQKYFWYGYLVISAFVLTCLFAKLIPLIGVLAYVIATILGIIKYLRVENDLKNDLAKHYYQSQLADQDIDRSIPIQAPVKSEPIDWSVEAAATKFSFILPTATQGASEKFFFKHLTQYFGKRASFGFGYPIPGSPNPYTSDFEVKLENGLGIQVEIDEPYAYNTGEPHHSTSNNKDEKRNAFFIERGWIIVRFAEEQICVNPRGCCGAIAQIILDLTNDPQWEELAKSASTLSRIPTWTDAAAKKMLKIKYRDTYLAKIR